MVSMVSIVSIVSIVSSRVSVVSILSVVFIVVVSVPVSSIGNSISVSELLKVVLAMGVFAISCVEGAFALGVRDADPGFFVIGKLPDFALGMCEVAFAAPVAGTLNNKSSTFLNIGHSLVL